MNLALVDQIAKAVLYEGYMLYPYRPSSVKNQQRWNFGVVYPRDYSQAQGGDEPCSMRTECLLAAKAGAILEVKVRFLHLGIRLVRASTEARPSSLPDGWQEAVEREVSLLEFALRVAGREALKCAFKFPAQAHLPSQNDGQQNPVDLQQEAVEGMVTVSGERVGEGLFKVSVEVQNVTPVGLQGADREVVLMQSLVSTHVILGVKDGEFVSLLEPPAELQEFASTVPEPWRVARSRREAGAARYYARFSHHPLRLSADCSGECRRPVRRHGDRRNLVVANHDVDG